MPSYKTILVAIKDLDARTMPAVRKAAQLAKSRRSRLLVGHNPHLAELAALLLGLPDGGEGIRFRKAGLMALERRSKPDRARPFGAWSLLWMVPPDLTK